MVLGGSDAASFFIAISGAVVNHVDGALPKRRSLVHAVRDRAVLLGPMDTWSGEWIALGAAPVTAKDVGAWPCSVSILVKWVAFLGSLHWPVGGADLGVGGVSFVEVLILFE